MELGGREQPAKPPQINFYICMYETIVYGHIQADYGYSVKSGYLEDEEGNKRQQRSDKQVDDVASVICENVHFFLRVVNCVKEPEGANFVSSKMVKPDKELT